VADRIRRIGFHDVQVEASISQDLPAALEIALFCVAPTAAGLVMSIARVRKGRSVTLHVLR